jgi:hypothetical protein
VSAPEQPLLLDSGTPTADGPTPTRRRRSAPVLYATLAVTGFSFWFALGFPYANHNESFSIVAQLRNIGLGDAMTHTLVPVANYRPLGQAVAWLGYHAGGTIFPVEVFNFVGAVAAWVLLFVALRERKVFAFTALFVGGVFFTGYIYLFHLHGVFYSPLLLLFAMLFWLDREFTRTRVLVLAVCALVAGLFHPYAFLVFAAALGGMAIEHRKSLTGLRGVLVVSTTVAVVLLAVIVAFQPNPNVLTESEMIDGFLVSYQLVEINLIASAVALGLAIVTSLSLPVGNGLRYGAAVATGVVGLVFVQLGLPVLFVWIAVCLVKTVLLRKWWMALVLCGSALFPAPTATGSPTYVIFVLMMCAAILPYGWTAAETRLRGSARITAVAVIAVAVALLIPLRLGVDVPVVSRLAQPLIAEREKTFQMEEIVNWLVASEYASYQPVLVRDADNPIDASDAVDRTFRPPTNQWNLDMYVEALRDPGTPPPSEPKKVLVGFGGVAMPPGEVLLALPAPHAGEARVVLPSTGPGGG